MIDTIFSCVVGLILLVLMIIVKGLISRVERMEQANSHRFNETHKTDVLLRMLAKNIGYEISDSSKWYKIEVKKCSGLK